MDAGLCFQGDRFGGALDAAARLFSHGVDSGQAPMEFVNDMRKKGQLIMGIGHRVKSVSTLRAGVGEKLTGRVQLFSQVGEFCWLVTRF